MDFPRLALTKRLSDAERRAPKVPDGDLICRTIELVTPYRPAVRLRPDFVALYRLPGPNEKGEVPPLRCRDELCTAAACEQACALGEAADAVTLTPRAAFMLALGARRAAEYLREAVNEWGLCLGPGRTLPPAVLRYLERQGEQLAGAWLARFENVLFAIEARVAIGEIPLPRSTAEEMALHLTLDQAEEFLEEEDVLPGLSPHDTLMALPAAADELDLDYLREVLFEDHDVLMLFNPTLDGIEDPSSSLARSLRTANLHPSAWFDAFRAANPPDPAGPPLRTEPLEVRLAARDETSVTGAFQHFLDTVIGAGRPIEVSALTTYDANGRTATDEEWSARIGDLDASANLELCLEVDTDDETLHYVYLVLWEPEGVSAASGEECYDLEEVRPYLFPLPAAAAT